MRIRSVLVISASVLSMAFAVVPSAAAQSFFQKLFGTGSQPNADQRDLPRARAVIPQHRFQSRSITRTNQSRRGIETTSEEDVGPPDSGGPYKTMCVRACDGFYFPLRHNARRKNFASDVRSCRNACGSDARLFYFALRDGEGPESMVDLSGRKYAESQNAFAYRKKLVDGCACKPEPWSYEEARRHQSYADQQVVELPVEAEAEKSNDVATAAGARSSQDVTAQDSERDPFQGHGFGEAQGAASPADDAVDLTRQLNAAIGPQPAEAPMAGDAASAATVMPPRVLRRRARGYLQPATYRLVPTSGLRRY